jgi:hypothetical protein
MNASRKLMGTAAVVVLALALPSVQAASKEEVSKARAECASQKQKVKAMEGKGAGDELTAARKAWENACQQAELLMNQMNGTKEPEPAPAPEAPTG